MEHHRVSMRGKTKDAEAEALLKLLRQEQEFHNQVSIPKIQRKQPLPSIRSKTIDPMEVMEEQQAAHESSGVFISQMRTDVTSEESFNKLQCRAANNNNIIPNSCNVLPPTDLTRSYEWKNKTNDNTTYQMYERKPSKTLPPLAPQSASPRERPSRPPLSSPKFCREDE